MHLGEGLVVLAQYRDRGLERADGLEHVLLLGVELRQLLLAQRRRLRQRGLVLRDFLLALLNFGRQLRDCRRVLLDLARVPLDRLLLFTG